MTAPKTGPLPPRSPLLQPTGPAPAPPKGASKGASTRTASPPSGAGRLAGYASGAAPASPADPRPPRAGAPRAQWESYLKTLAPGLEIVDGDRKWTATELQAVAAEASRLSARDRGLLGSATLVRTKSVPAERVGVPSLADTVLSVEGKATITFGDGVAKAGFGPAFIHEMGHVAMGGGQYSPTRIRDFAKLSQFQQTDEMYALYSGVNWRGHSVDFAGKVEPGRTDNFVSDYARTSPFEDYAESYRLYYDDPKTLLARAPDKFLYLNADSGKYPPSEVARLLKAAGKDGRQVASDLVRDGWQTADSLERILGFNGLTADPGAVHRTQASVRGTFELLLGKGPQSDAFRAEFGADPKGALLARGLWNDLSQDIRASLENAEPASLQAMLDSPALAKLVAGQPDPEVARYVSAGSQRAASYFFVELRDAKGNGWAERFNAIAAKGIAYKAGSDDWGALHQASARIAEALATGKPPDFLAKLERSPEQALGKALWKQLDPTMRATIEDPDFQARAAIRLKSGLAGEEAIAADLEDRIYRRGVRDLLAMLLGPDPALRDAIAGAKGDVAKALAYKKDAGGEMLADRLPSALRYLLFDTKGLRSAELQGMLSSKQLQDVMRQMAQNPDGAVARNARKLLGSLTVTDALAFTRSLNGMIPEPGKSPAPVADRQAYGDALGARLAEALARGALTFSGAGAGM